MIIIELIIDTKDAMGANVINTMCELVGSELEKITKCTVILKILSNYSTKRMARCKAIFPKELIGGSNGVNRILYAYAFAYSDIYRAVTHNKGLMNGIDGVAMATGQDVRAIEAAVHAYASNDGKYRSLTKWNSWRNRDSIGYRNCRGNKLSTSICESSFENIKYKESQGTCFNNGSSRSSSKFCCNSCFSG
jgi:hydroxymethylglutaryl-CoA reductase